MSRRDAADEDDHYVDDDGGREVGGTLVPLVCKRHPEVTYRTWGGCPRCQGEENRRITDQLAQAIRQFKAAIVTGDDEAQRQVRKQLVSLGCSSDYLRDLVAAVTSKLGAAPARRARREDL